MRRKDKQLLAFVKKKKKPPPFQGKVLGGTARARPDRKALGGGVKKRQEGGTISSVRRRPVPGERREPPPLTGPTERMQRGGAVAAKADAEPISPNEPNAPAGGRVAQKFQLGGVLSIGPGDVGRAAPFVRGVLKRGGPVKRQAGGDVKDQEDQANNDEQEDKDISEYKRGGVLSAKQRQALPSSSFALPGKGKGPKGAGAGSYPIPDESHARNALARVSQHGSPAEKATVRAKVKRKYPGIQVGG
jgi:hypothetical protein